MSKNLLNLFTWRRIINSYIPHKISSCNVRTIRTDWDYTYLFFSACWIFFMSRFFIRIRILSDVFEMLKFLGGINDLFKLFAINVSLHLFFQFCICVIIEIPDPYCLIIWPCCKSYHIFVGIWHDFKVIYRPIMSQKCSMDLNLLPVFHVPNQSHFIWINDGKLVSFDVKKNSYWVCINRVFPSRSFGFLIPNRPIRLSKRRRLWKCVQVLKRLCFKNSDNSIGTCADYALSIKSHP